MYESRLRRLLVKSNRFLLIFCVSSVLKGLLDYGSRLLRDRLNPRSRPCQYLFADHYGKILRKIGAFLQVQASFFLGGICF
ncbi:hypothetical protein CW705_07800, partial [Candidatus Bathyarchaeota archaeon]